MSSPRPGRHSGPWKMWEDFAGAVGGWRAGAFKAKKLHSHLLASPPSLLGWALLFSRPHNMEGPRLGPWSSSHAPLVSSASLKALNSTHLPPKHDLQPRPLSRTAVSHVSCHPYVSTGTFNGCLKVSTAEPELLTFPPGACLSQLGW